MAKQYIQINDKPISFEELARALDLDLQSGQALNVSLCQEVAAGTLRANLYDYGGDYPGIDVELHLPKEQNSAPIPISRTEQPQVDGPGVLRTFGFGRSDEYFMFFDTDFRPDREVDVDFSLPSITVSGHPAAAVVVDAENPYVNYNGYRPQAMEHPAAPQETETLDAQIANCRSSVCDQIHLLMEAGYINSDQQIYADLHLDEITRQYLIRREAWIINHNQDISLSAEMEIMHEEIRKAAETVSIAAKADTPLHETSLYRKALAHFCSGVGHDIENDFVRNHAGELIFCYENDKTLIDFDFWTRYETLLGEHLCWDEYMFLDEMYEDDPMDIDESDFATIAGLSADLESYRHKPEPLANRIIDATDKSDQQISRQLNREEDLTF